jgi:hypothetical protein
MALVPCALAVLASHIKLRSDLSRMEARLSHLEEERSEMKSMLQDLCQMVNEIKLILAKNQM